MTMLTSIPKRFRDEATTFPRGWYCVAEAANVPAGSMLPVSCLDAQLVVYRDEMGAPHVADAYCPHLGAHLASSDGCIENGEIVCPFHKWRFSTTSGECSGIPYSSSVPPRAKLTVHPTIELAGMVMMWWDPRGGAPGPRPFDPFAAYGDKTWVRHSTQMYETTVPLSDMFENVFDTAHIQQLHRSVHVPEIASVERVPHGIEVTIAPSKEGERTKTDVMQFNFSGVGLGTMLSLGDDFGFLSCTSVTPIDGERSVMQVRMFIMDTGSPEKNEMIGAGYADRVAIEIRQDLKVLDYKKHVARPVLCRGDGPVMKWRKYVGELVDA